MYSEMTVEQRADLIKTAFLTELNAILSERLEMSKKAAAPGGLLRSLMELAQSGGRGAERAGEALRALESGVQAGRVGPGELRAVQEMAEEASTAQRGYRVGGQAAAAAVPEMAPGAVPPTPPSAAVTPAVAGTPGAAAATAGVPAAGDQVAAQVGAGGDLSRLQQLQMAGLTGGGKTMSHLLLPAIAGIGTGLATHSIPLGLLAAGGTYGLGRLGQVGRGPTLQRMADTAGEQAWRAEAAAAAAEGRAPTSMTKLPYVAKAREELLNTLRQNPDMIADLSRAARPGYLRGAAMAIPGAAALGYWGGKKVLEGVTDTGEGSSKNPLVQIPLSILGGYGGYQGGQYAAQQLGLPDWTKYLTMLAGGALLPRAVG